MKKISFLMAAGLLSAATLQAKVEGPTYWSENFQQMGIESEYPTDGWICRGIDAKPASMWVEWFEGRPAYAILQYGEVYGTVSCTNFDPSQAANQWLISPEIEIQEDEASLGFSTFYYYNSGQFGEGPCPYEIYVSETGTEPADFTKLYSARQSGIMGREVTMADRVISLNGYKGKKIHVAFVNKGKDCGPMGFTNMSIGSYFFKAENLSDAIAENGSEVTIDINMYLKTPVACPGAKILLEVNGVTVKEEYVNKSFYSSSAIPQPTRVTIPNAFKMDGTAQYTVYITPDYEGAVTSTITDVIGVPKTKYLNNIFVEEFTATGCGFCPSGIAAMDYFKDTYPGTATVGKFIGVAIHGNMNYPDPMNRGINYYYSPAFGKSGCTGLPGAFFNRATKGANPWDINFAQLEANRTSYNKVEISSVEYPEMDDLNNIIGRNVKVNFNGFSAYDAKVLDLTACAILIENDVKGNEDGYKQENYLYSQTYAQAAENYGPVASYLGEFLVGGKLAVNIIPYDMMTYQHVARGIWPDYAGQDITDSWIADTPLPLSLNITVPEEVMNFENTEVIVILTNKNTGRVVASDIIPFSKYTAVSGVHGVNADKASIVRDGNLIKVVADDATPVEVYSVDGSRLASAVVVGGEATIDASSFSGLVIVKAGEKSAKLIF